MNDIIPPSEGKDFSTFFSTPHVTERRKVKWEPSAKDRAIRFAQLMRTPQAPKAFNLAVLKQFFEWGLIDENTVNDQTALEFQRFNEVSKQVENGILASSKDFDEKFKANPWNFDRNIEGRYLPEELSEKYPMGSEISTIIGEECSFIFLAQSGEHYMHLIERADEHRQAVRTITTDRTAEEINTDAAIAPDILPRFEAIKLGNGETALLINWISGRKPRTDEEKALCLAAADKLLTIPMDSFDVWPGNFLIMDDPDGNSPPHIYYVDRDVIEKIATHGYSEASPDRVNRLEKNKIEKMK